MKPTKICIKENKVSTASIPVYFFKLNKSDKIIFAECPSLSICTYGNNLKHAKTMFQEAFGLWLEDVCENDNIIEVLQELGWTMTKSAISPKEEYHNVPLELIASKSLNLQVPIGN
ncbi:MAG: hypothetical protein LBT79_07845 [Elusimicrobiota bacterium]|jgi:predicted RNase H-like HicB family nuclease|nr:hypothetical protein [Elusimicrobiota bacterium]